MLSLLPARTTWRYGPRSLPVLLLDLGHAVASLLAAARALGMHAVAEFGVPGERLAAPAALPWHDGAVRWPGTAPEFPLAAVHLGGPVDLTGPRRADSGVRPEAEPRSVIAAAQSAHRMVAAALSRLAAPDPPRMAATAPPGAHSWSSATGPAFTAAALLARSSAPWQRIATAAESDWTDVLAAARAHVGARAALLRPRAHPAAARALADRSCGQPVCAAADALLLVFAAPEACIQHTLHTYTTAARAVHAAWLTATEAGRAARPIGCWIDAGAIPHPDNGTPARLVHALALGDG
ncbi:hypothetical protein [Allonocardiopsis opalescens]|uniref:Uncharacterized protein n=1 Tax=Allonocardiopsis opalescens TaxID=1144618 RepID=A0A2T0Q1T1_9ACTN|nr:hypothetical protein [Allonocardiopsis opalescens]PRX97762.1 hypothetical protein CLV72_105112 [Allonocardiopsis opalescens]